MPFEGRPLREITEADLRQLVQSGMAEHLYLNYKQEVYGNNQAGCREHLLDMCMFANAQGGLILIGIAERRDEQGQPTGIPDAGAVLGVEVANPEALLQSYDARVVSSIEERLHIESYPIPIEPQRYVLAFRIPNSANKPHCVRYQGHVYFPSRRERNRYPMDVREIKELAMRAATQLERAEEILAKAIDFESQGGDDVKLYMGLVPVFFRDFLFDITKTDILQKVATFDVFGTYRQETPQYTFDGLERPDRDGRTALTVMRNGLVRLRASIRTIPGNIEGVRIFRPQGTDWLIRRFVVRSQDLYRAASITGPVLLAVKLVLPQGTRAAFGELHEGDYQETPVAGNYKYPMLIDVFEQPAERSIRLICNHIHQTCGRLASPNFAENGDWVGPT